MRARACAWCVARGAQCQYMGMTPVQIKGDNNEEQLQCVQQLVRRPAPAPVVVTVVVAVVVVTRQLAARVHTCAKRNP